MSAKWQVRSAYSTPEEIEKSLVLYSGALEEEEVGSLLSIRVASHERQGWVLVQAGPYRVRMQRGVDTVEFSVQRETANE